MKTTKYFLVLSILALSAMQVSTVNGATDSVNFFNSLDDEDYNETERNENTLNMSSLGYFRHHFLPPSEQNESSIYSFNPEVYALGMQINDSGTTKRRQSSSVFYVLYKEERSYHWVDFQVAIERLPLKHYWDSLGMVKILIHGFTSPSDTYQEKVKSMKDIAYAYRDSHPTSNLILMDWTALSTYGWYNYAKAADNVPRAGYDIINFLNQLTQGWDGYNKWPKESSEKTRVQASRDNIHIVGFSLGAHVAGFAGQQALRITGIEPAGPLFHYCKKKFAYPTNNALTQDKAEQVDILHCNMGCSTSGTNAFSKGTYGTPAISGHTSFYVEGGKTQEGCSRWQDRKEGCSHSKCIKHFIRSIQEVAWACDIEKISKSCKDHSSSVKFGDQLEKWPEDGGRYWFKY